jgi:hypothetical protein
MKNVRRSFAFGSSQRNRMTLMFGAARFWRPGSSPHAAQVLQGMMDFRRSEASHLAMQLKHLQQRAFSQLSAHRRAHLAFTSPQRA